MVLSREIHGSSGHENGPVCRLKFLSGASQDDVNHGSIFRFVPHSHSTSPVTNLGTDLKDSLKNAIYVLREHVGKRQLGTVHLKMNPAFVPESKDRASRAWLVAGEPGELQELGCASS